jgi:hypothetical protein
MCVLVFLSVVPVLAQQNSGLIGTVIDGSGAAVTDADITVKNQGTGFVRKVTTGGTGEYSVPNLPVGVYQVEVAKTGFKTGLARDIKLDVQRTSRVDFTMQLDSVLNTLTVVSSTPLLQTTESQVSTLMENREIQELPLDGRNYIQLNFLVPGTSHGNSNADYIFGTHGGDAASSFSVNGIRSIYNSYLIDGVPTNDVADGAPSFEPSIDAIEEFRTQTSNYTAQLGGMAGGQVNLITKAGTNNYHGTAYEFLRNDFFDAAPFSFDTPGTHSPLKRHNFGGALGGPIFRNRTFFFASYEALRLVQGGIQLGLVPTQAMRNGDLRLLPSGLPNDQIRNPITGALFPNQQVPVNPIVANYLNEFVPLPNIPYNAVHRFNWVSSSPATISHNGITGRIDHSFSQRDLLFGRWLYGTVYNISAKLFPTDSYELGSTGENFALGYTHIVAANKVNEMRLAFNRFLQYETNGRAGKENVLGKLGIHGFCEDPGCWGQPEFDVLGYLSFGEHGNGQVVSGPRRWTDDDYNFSETFSYTVSSHTLKAGMTFDLYHDSFLQNIQPRGQYGFDGHFTDPTVDPKTGKPAPVPSTNTSFADFLLAYPQNLGAIISPQTPYFSYRGIAPWVQDDWRVTPSLTVNLGLRYEWLGRPVSRYNNFASVDFETNPPQPVTPGNAAQFNYPNRLVNGEKLNFAPRVGFAWSPTRFKRVVVRSAWGIFYGRDLIGVWTDLTVNPPFMKQTNFTLNNSGQASDPNYIGNFNLANPLANAFAAAGFLDAIERNHRQALVQQWNLGLQYEIAHNTQITLTYVGNKATHLQREYDINQPPPGDPATQVLGPRPFPTLGPIIYLDSGGFSTYHSLQIEAEHRYSNGLSLLSSYTFGKCIDDNSGGDYGEYGGGGVKYMDIHKLCQLKGRCSQDTRHRFTTSYVYDLPFGRGKRFGSSLHPIVAHTISNWQISGIATVEAGQPFSVLMPGDYAIVGDATSNTISTYSVTPNLVGKCDLPSSKRSILKWFNTSAFQDPGFGHFGNAGRNICTAPGFVNFDVGVSRNFVLWRESHLQFRAEAFNVFNHPNLKSPGLGFLDGNYGQLTDAGPPRKLQFALKYVF